MNVYLPMKAPLLVFLALTSSCFAAEPPKPRDFLIGQVCRDAKTALSKGKAAGKPVWIIAWDDKFKDEPKTENIADYYLRYSYQNPETKKLVSANFVQCFTKLSDPDIAQWVDKNDKSHVPIYIVFDKDGVFRMRELHPGNPVSSLKDFQKVVDDLSQPAPTRAAAGAR